MINACVLGIKPLPSAVECLCPEGKNEHTGFSSSHGALRGVPAQGVAAYWTGV